MFEKPSFKPSAKHRRCLIYVDAFYEHHHLKSKTYPFHISAADGNPLALGGLWNEWLDKETGEIIKTVSIVTCEANKAMKIIHNNPKAEGPRMPFIIPKEHQDYWLDTDHVGEEELQEFVKPYPSDQLKYYTVQKMLGKAALGNVPEAEQEYIYEELSGLSLV
ncbi:MAG: SOS response-associated peptidase [Bacteroidetes bacterium]|nr:SOS response-associated peptidase [Bacteroidota bacterium]